MKETEREKVREPEAGRHTVTERERDDLFI